MPAQRLFGVAPVLGDAETIIPVSPQNGTVVDANPYLEYAFDTIPSAPDADWRVAFYADLVSYIDEQRQTN